MITIEIINDNKDFLNKMAVEAMITYFNRSPPKSFKESEAIARVCYRQALAMLNVNMSELETLALETRVIKKEKK